MENILEIRRLKVSFRTPGGVLKAVRDVSLSLEKGKTLAIVGESGSGKSVTSRAVMQLLAGNSIVEGGEILYDGKDLLKISEDEMCNIRGNEISMIFQDPLSSLNPIVKIGKQITEAMLLKDKSNRRVSKKDFNDIMSLLEKDMAAAGCDSGRAKDLCSEFEKACRDASDAVKSNTDERGGVKVPSITLDGLSDEFMAEFKEYVKKGLVYSFDRSLDAKKALIADLEAAKEYYSGEFTRKDGLKYAKELTSKVEDSIDRLQIHKESVAYTFGSAMNDAIEKYFYYQKENVKEENRYAKQEQKREKQLAKGKAIDWQVVPKNILDLDELKNDIVSVVTRLEDLYQEDIEGADGVDQDARSDELIDFFKDKAVRSVYHITKQMAKATALELMDEVGIAEPERRLNQYPFEFSGGMRQRIVIAIALAADPEILICDEPTTALDVTIQSQILELINKLKEERNLSVIFITHDLGVVANVADDIAVMYAGKIVEYGTADDIFYDPRHPYTWALLSSMPDLDTKEKLDAIPGTPPNMIYPPEGDAFAARNKYAMKIDFERQPPMFKISDTHYAATWLLAPGAPKVEVPAVITERIERMKAKAGESA